MLVQEERSDSCPRLTVDQGPVDGGCAAVGGQQRGMEVERALGRHGPHHARQHPEGHHDEHVGIPASEGRQELLVLEGLRLKQRQSYGHGVFLDRAEPYLLAPAYPAVRHRDGAHYIVPSLHQGAERSYSELWGTHKHYTQPVSAAEHAVRSAGLLSFIH